MGFAMFLAVCFLQVVNLVTRTDCDQTEFGLSSSTGLDLDKDGALLDKRVIFTSRSYCNEGAEVAFIIDSSGSLGLQKYTEQKIFLKKVMKELKMESSQFNAAVVQYSNDASLDIAFNDSLELQLLDSAVDRLVYRGGLPRADKALQLTAELVFTNNSGSRKNASKMAVLFASSPPSSLSDALINASKILKEQGVRIVVVVLQKDIPVDKLSRLTERGEKDVISDLGNVAEKICKASGNPKVFVRKYRVIFKFFLTGSTIKLHCYAEGWPMPNVKWLVNGQELRNGDYNQTVHVEIREQRPRLYTALQISDVGFANAGNYTCQAENKYRVNKYNVQVFVSCAPPLVTVTALQPEKDFLSVTLSCAINNIPSERNQTMTWIWRFVGKDLQENHKYKMFHTYSAINECQQFKTVISLSISNASEQDLGQYSCVVEDSNRTVGQAEVLVTDFVNSKAPLAPSILYMVVLNCGKALMVKWKRYLVDSGSPITEYQAQLRSTDGRWKSILSFPSHNLSHVFEGLISNTKYDFKVRAKNKEGFGHWAEKGVKTIADVPTLIGMVIYPHGCGVHVSIDDAPDSKCLFLGYTAHYRKNNSTAKKGKWREKTLGKLYAYPSGLSFLLECDTKYEVMIVAWNERGHSDVSEKSVRRITTEKGVPFKPWIEEVKLGQCGVLKVYWDAPFDTEFTGGPVTGYVAQIRKADHDNKWLSCTTPVDRRNCSFYGLLGGATYEVRVQAVNVKGPGKWTYIERSTVTTLGPPDAPMILNKETELTGRNATVMWVRPFDNNCSITMYTIYFRIIEPFSEPGDWTAENITDTNVTTREIQLQFSKKYEVIISAWNERGEKKSHPWHLRTAQDVPYAPEVHQLSALECASINVMWSPPTRESLGGPVTGYLAQVKLSGSEDPWLNCTTHNTSSSARSCLFVALKQNSLYEVRIRAKNSIGYGSPSLKNTTTTRADRPDTPIIQNTEVEVSGCDVTLQWNKPSSNGCPITLYVIQYRQRTSLSNERAWNTRNVTANTEANRQNIDLNCSTSYEFEVNAWNEKGRSDSPSRTWPITTGGGKKEEATKSNSDQNAGSFLSRDSKISLAIASVTIFIVFLAIVIRYFQRKVRNRLKRNRREIRLLENCEIPPIRAKFLEELGQGAFGRVYKAQLKDALDYFSKQQEGWRKTRMTVAVKVLRDKATEEQRREFLDEIEHMKHVGKHKNVLSFLGCWTTTEPLLLIIEYAAHGDLLHWLRKRRNQVASSVPSEVNDRSQSLYEGSRRHSDNICQKSTEDTKRATTLNEGENAVMASATVDISHEDPSMDDEDQIPIVAHVSLASRDGLDVPEENKTDDCSDDCDTFNQSDLLSFAWQIAQGMIYLSEKGLVHRDLAARNVLVGHGKRLKVADFGLMRQVYNDVYETKKQKKLPVKWMAPESLYDQVFTTKSDVWSYGVVMWEIATVGGSPYPSLGNTELLKLLKTGYRMEKPDMCSEAFYSLMTECWKQNPDERASFQQLNEILEAMMVQDVEYFDFGKVGEVKYYNLFPDSGSSEESIAL